MPSCSTITQRIRSLSARPASRASSRAPAARSGTCGPSRTASQGPSSRRPCNSYTATSCAPSTSSGRLHASRAIAALHSRICGPAGPDLNASRTERVPWLEKTGFPAYLAGLQDSQIKSAYKLPPKDPAKATNSNRDLARILATVKTSPDCKITQQRANILNEFYTGMSGQAGGFRYRKEPSTLTDYFRPILFQVQATEAVLAALALDPDEDEDQLLL
ncbi:hypothetical protein NA56DRAFT_663276 [Hyaloscypha hepaticicola]|uniref:Uncharacterized protein n=1 Tax=Hyaloscypha hepaticicola TaxID=2082293 RepID=A0A2J6PQH1_9HELO|nr:hypothetical protein NA56DRAFT_663276 [Hyaloscypha hepaticicola]